MTPLLILFFGGQREGLQGSRRAAANVHGGQAEKYANGNPSACDPHSTGDGHQDISMPERGTDSAVIISITPISLQENRLGAGHAETGPEPGTGRPPQLWTVRVVAGVCVPLILAISV